MAPTIVGHIATASDSSSKASSRRRSAARQVPRPKCARAEGSSARDWPKCSLADVVDSDVKTMGQIWGKYGEYIWEHIKMVIMHVRGPCSSDPLKHCWRYRSLKNDISIFQNFQEIF